MKSTPRVNIRNCKTPKKKKKNSLKAARKQDKLCLRKVHGTWETLNKYLLNE